MTTEIEVQEATVSTRQHPWGVVKSIHVRSPKESVNKFSIPLHPHQQEMLQDMKDGDEYKFTDEKRRAWNARREGDNVHFKGGKYGTQACSICLSVMFDSSDDDQGEENSDRVDIYGNPVTEVSHDKLKNYLKQAAINKGVHSFQSTVSDDEKHKHKVEKRNAGIENAIKRLIRV